MLLNYGNLIKEDEKVSNIGISLNLALILQEISKEQHIEKEQ